MSMNKWEEKIREIAERVADMNCWETSSVITEEEEEIEI